MIILSLQTLIKIYKIKLMNYKIKLLFNLTLNNIKIHSNKIKL